MSLEEFCDNCRGINGGHDLPRAFLAALYASVRGREIRAHPESGGGGGGDGGEAPRDEAPSLERWRYLAQRRGLPSSPAKIAPPPAQLEAELCAQLCPVALRAAAGALQAAPAGGTPTAGAQEPPWRAALRVCVASVQLEARRCGPQPPRALSWLVSWLCEQSQLPALVGRADRAAAFAGGTCGRQRSRQPRSDTAPRGWRACAPRVGGRRP